ncbi:MAG TPA: glycoside hydrolase family 3 C-terminal domain-containing protein [Acidobacteriaceae bacterium]|jgi:beta-glucosidase|nr:glycoside hydrolase family 3 C-terminal domain-containing protein [Acidobacteriaceae bacterium]
MKIDTRKILARFRWCGLLTSATLLASSCVFAQGPKPVTPEMRQKVDALVQKLTLEQKITLIGGEDDMFIKAMPSIGLPRLKMSDGPLGVRTWGPSTAFAGGIGLAASWDTKLADRVGVMLGEDARARGVNFLLGPGINIYRAPMDGRNFEFFGEDPYLAGQMAANYILGVQSQGVSATVKHFVANNSEFDRHNVNSIVDERTLREIYLPAFEAAVKQGHTGAVMDSYNLINGEHATQNAFLNNQVLKKDWGFQGVLMSDWDATYDGVAAANAGLDLEMPSGRFMNEKTLLPAVKSGKVPEAVIDDKVRRILLTAMRFGWLDRDQTDLSIPLLNQDADAVALQSAEEGAVLLKNEGSLLPLNKQTVHSIAVIGPDSYPAVPGGGGSSTVTAFAPVSFMGGLSKMLAPDVKVYWDAGIQSPQDIFSNTHWCTDATCSRHGLTETKYIQATNQKLTSGVNDHVDNVSGSEWGDAARIPLRVEWTGFYVPKQSGVYRFYTQGVGETRYRLMVDGKQVLEETHHEGQAPKSAIVTLRANKPAQIQFLVWPMTDNITAGLGVIAQDKLIDPEAIRLAKMADVAVVNVGFGPDSESEGFDRTFELPGGQDELIQAITAANPHTIVTLTAGGSVDTHAWIANTPVLLHTWYAGQEAGTALAKILFGEVDPSGKLPISFEKRIEDNPTYKNYYEQTGTHDVKYAEGLFVGYRYYDKSQVKPLFPFGFGLSYTTFAFHNLTITPDKASPDSPITVGFDVENTGSRAGAEVAEVYVGDPSARVERPIKELKGFTRVSLNPGETKHATVTLNRRSFAYWDTRTEGWKVDPGKFVVYVGDSSANVPLQKNLTLQ